MTSATTTQHFFLQGRYLGARQISAWFRLSGEAPRYQHSYVLFCGRCGDIWARLIVDGAPYTQVIQTPCRAHGDGRISCSPRWKDHPTCIDISWPSEAIRYEFERTLEQAIKDFS